MCDLDRFSKSQSHIKYCGTQSDAVYFDIRKAFDSVCHNQLLVKLWSAGISGQLWSWFRSYLSDRSQFVVINNQPSSLLPVLSGVPQGSILGPLLFLIYINDIFHINIHHSLLTFADDTKCFGPVTNCTDDSYCNMVLIHYLTGVLDHIYVSTLPNVYIFHLEPTESHHIT